MEILWTSLAGLPKCAALNICRSSTVFLVAVLIISDFLSLTVHEISNVWSCKHFTRPAGINTLFPLSRPTLQKGAAQKILVKNFILFFAIYTVNLVYYP